MSRPNQRNNFTIINEDTREPPISALKHAMNSQLKQTLNWYNSNKKIKAKKQINKETKTTYNFDVLIKTRSSHGEHHQGLRILKPNLGMMSAVMGFES